MKRIPSLLKGLGLGLGIIAAGVLLHSHHVQRTLESIVLHHAVLLTVM